MKLITSVLAAYWGDARVFAYAHLVLAFFVLRSLISFAGWKFDDEPAPTIWQQFEIRSNYIRGLIGLFLIVGITGTFLGLWEVASAFESVSTAAAAADTGAAAKTTETIHLLLKGIAKAFPVGLVGLVLTLFANLVADKIESEKRKKIEKFMDQYKDPVLTKITEVLQPVANLGNILGKSLQPVIDNLATTLKPIPEAISAQGEELAKAKTALVEAAAALKESGAQISESVVGLKDMAKTSRAALEGATKLSDGISKYFERITTKLDQATAHANEAFTSYDQALAEMTDSVNGAAETMRRLPEDIRSSMTEMLAEGYEDSSKAREARLDDLYSSIRQKFQENLINALTSVTSRFEHLKDEFDTVGDRVDQSVANAQNSFERYDDAWNREAQTLREQIVEQIDPKFRTEMADAAYAAKKSLDDAAKSARDFVSSTHNTSNEINRLYQDAARRLSSSAELLASQLTRINTTMETSTSRLGVAVQNASAKRSAPGVFRRAGRAIANVARSPIHLFSRKKNRA